ncbi:sugar phosphate isomerase/epimerase [Verrucomicrobiaceae bacterium N1E253]|uniref:Sugar phosphate isomerase/epimerase n=1 Tax=Oceaniferula marina TaxID=2748318 RepID=A0A851GKJ4_9BACT|nr:sugar phosphate isomerase/epimerase [Oceaniferula marina]NWK55695.1 sugar phosphate isomerase/epimerase [Oceaniferula marina]
MKLGFVSAILPDLSLEELLAFASENDFDTLEPMCWPCQKEVRRYAGVTHIDVADFTQKDADGILLLVKKYGVSLSGLGYYPNPLAADQEEASVYIHHLHKVIDASAMLGLNQVNTFIGRDPSLSQEENWKLFDQRWPSIVEYAESKGVRIGIENCPMFFTEDEYPGGKNLAVSPAIWREMFARIPSDSFGLNYDPSHFVWQQMDPVQPIKEFASKIFHIHAKDVRIDRDRLNEVGILAPPNAYHCPKLPGLGEIDWGRFFSVLTDTGYDGPVCIEVEDRAYEATEETRKASLRQSGRFLRNYIAS